MDLDIEIQNYSHMYYGLLHRTTKYSLKIAYV